MNLSAPIFKLRRKAKLFARERGIPLHQALDEVATSEGFQNWGHLAASMPARSPAKMVLNQLNVGDLVLLGGRPGHGKTLLGIEMAFEAVKQGCRSYFFTLDYNEADVAHHVRQLGVDVEAIAGSFVLDTSDEVCADYVADQLNETGDAFVVVDYLQLLDQRRSNPLLADQVEALKIFAEKSGAIVVVLSQIDRSFELQKKSMPDLSDIRLPNPVDCSHFTKACFLHDGEIRLQAA